MCSQLPVATRSLEALKIWSRHRSASRGAQISVEICLLIYPAALSFRVAFGTTSTLYSTTLQTLLLCIAVGKKGKCIMDLNCQENAISSDVLARMLEDAIVYIRCRTQSSWGNYIFQFKGFADAKLPSLLPSLCVSPDEDLHCCRWRSLHICMGSKALTATVLAPNSHYTQEDPDAEPGFHAHTCAFETENLSGPAPEYFCRCASMWPVWSPCSPTQARFERRQCSDPRGWTFVT